MKHPYRILLWAILALLHGRTFATVIKVHPAAGSIQGAIRQARPGDTVLLSKGIYKEHDIYVDKRVVILGEQYPVVDGQGRHQLFIITADSAVIQGLQVQNTGISSLVDMAAIRVQEAGYVKVAHNRLLNNTYGIYLQKSHHCTVVNNQLQAQAVDEQNSGNGIHAWKSGHLRIQGNHITGHRDGIYFEFVTQSDISDNISVSNVRYGLHFMFSNDDAYTRNTFSGNGAGVAVMFSKRVTMHGNVFKDNWGDAAYGLLLKEISDGTIAGNLFVKNTVAIYMEGAARLEVKRNTFTGNGWAMRMQASCSNGLFTENNFTGNSFDVATNGTMMLNTFRGNYWDKYDGYDLDRDGTGDVPYYPVSVYAVITEKIPAAMILYRSFLTNIMDQVEKVMPSIIPDQLKDDAPRIKKWKL
ncbi:nitrous oxide reductase family maturation protein NosD [Chitinophaga japonensis]|uniref:Nitrous oxidase accessory protein n=1 Tax=Chitinophaga japonensis TaxID=104662 RepID=A0A562SMU7_CHIJA|nr:nitrous oxide reductase family maturation protein NosD [Chitinophaga japonensis]TWI82538.1 nitrous oxidase accessory protein [Chitinophaga japonensis]